MRTALISMGFIFIALSTSLLAQAQDDSRRTTFRDWWQTPEQQAKQAWESGDNDSLQEVAPSSAWRGAAAYRDGDFAAALEAFTPGDNESLSLTSLYNQATTNIQLGDYANAIAQLEEVLAEQPENVNAARNRDIAMRLLELEQQQQQGEGGEGESNDEQQSSEEGEQNESDSNADGNEQNEQSSESDSDTQNSESQPSNEQNSDQQSQSGEPPEGESEDSSDERSASEEERESEVDDAREALQAAGEKAENELEQSQSEAVAAALNEEPLSEEDQATEQWLRQIPDDPDDLLRRKLLQNHRNEYPDVQRNGRGY